MPPVPGEEIYRARERIAGVALQTPLLPVLSLPVPSDNELWLKAESLQRTASFKIRGAANAIASLSAEERARGVITYSSGNHGQAVACAAHLRGVHAVVIMPEDAMAVKVAATRKWGAEVEFAGTTSLDRQQRAMELAEERGYTVVPPFDDPRIIAGQGTAGIEILEQLPEVQAVVVPVGGGGLLAGIATAIKSVRPEVWIIGAEPTGGADAQASFRSGTLTTLQHVDTVADGLRTSRLGELNFATIRTLVDDIVTVPDEETLVTVGMLLSGEKLVVEPSGAVAPAAVLWGRTGLESRRIAAVVSGGNVEPRRLHDCLDLATAAAAATANV